MRKRAKKERIESRRILERRLQLEMGQEELAELVKLKQQSIQKIEAGGGTRFLDRFAKALRTTQAYLLGETDDPRPPGAPLQSTFLPFLRLGEVKKWTEYPILTNQIRRKEMFFSEKVVGNNAFVLEITGDAMISPLDPDLRIKEGELAIADPALEPVPGKLVVAYIKSEDDEKLRQLTTDGKKQILKAYNPKYENIIVNEDVTILGVVVSISRLV